MLLKVKTINRKKPAYNFSLGEVDNALPLVANEHDDHVAVAVLSGILQPGCQMVECVPPSDVINQKCTCCSPIITSGDGSECLLSSLQRRT